LVISDKGYHHVCGIIPLPNMEGFGDKTFTQEIFQRGAILCHKCAGQNGG